MAGLLDFLQSASNTAADTVAAPVDLLAWALRKAGVPVPQNAIGGSEWLKQQGLKRDVPQSAASLAGETVSLLSPMVAAAKAPQIAKGLLQVEANSAAPSLLRSEAGVIDPFAKKKFIEELTAGRTEAPYRMGDVTDGQTKGLAGLVGKETPSTSDVFLTPDRFWHVYEARILRDGYSPTQVGDVADKGMQRRSRPLMDPASKNQHPALVNQRVTDPVTGRLYDATVPLELTEDGFKLVSVVPDGLPAPKKKPRQR